VLGPGRFGLSREKEAAGAACGLPLAMGFECRFLDEGAGETGFTEDWNAPRNVAWNEIARRRRAGGPAKRMILGSRHTGGATSPKRREASQKLSTPRNCQGVQPKRFAPSEAGLR